MKQRRSSAIVRTLNKLKQQCVLDSAAAIVASLPSTQLLTRFLTLPNVKKDKLDGLIAGEAGHQIPVPLPEVSLAHHVFGFPEETANIGRSTVLMQALRLQDAAQYQAVFDEAEIDVRAWQSDAVALYNWVHHEFLTREPAGKRRADVRRIAVLDLGRESIRVLFCGTTHLWFRANRLVAGDLANGLVRRFQLTHDMANQWLFNEGAARSMSAVHEQRCVIFRELVDRYETALKEFVKMNGEPAIERVLISGEAGHLPGLLRFLRLGR